MPVSHIEHLLLLVDDVDATAGWFVDNIGLEYGHTPGFQGAGDVALYRRARRACTSPRCPRRARRKSDSRTAIWAVSMSDQTKGTGIIDHVAFRCTGLPEIIARLEANSVEFLQRQANDGDLYQLFVTGPDGMRVELNFDAAEAEAPWHQAAHDGSRSSGGIVPTEGAILILRQAQDEDIFWAVT